MYIKDIKEGKLNAQLMERGLTWFDTETHIDLLHASNFGENITKTPTVL